MSALRALIAQVEPGWRVESTTSQIRGITITSVVTRTFMAKDQTYTYKGETHVTRAGGPAYMSREISGKRREFRYQWPLEGDDFEVEGTTLRIYNPAHAYVNGARAIVLTLVFSPPQD
ncbi:hypothetical protein [Rhodococcus qingshengii]|uniref:hypothetical protein n=1 Tax=Rhodococcus qingshengii TaxID=334542 RepID=UPI0035DD636C